MSVYIKNWSLADWKELLEWAKIGANNAMIGEFTEVEELPPHGRLIDADALLQHKVLLPMDGGHLPIVYASYVNNAPAVIHADQKEEQT